MRINPFQNLKLLPEESAKTTLKRENEFGEFLKEKLQEADQIQKQALQNLKDFAAGRNTDLTELTLSLAQADLSFRMVVRIRNKILEAYQEIMRMQI